MPDLDFSPATAGPEPGPDSSEGGETMTRIELIAAATAAITAGSNRDLFAERAVFANGNIHHLGEDFEFAMKLASIELQRKLVDALAELGQAREEHQ